MKYLLSSVVLMATFAMSGLAPAMADAMKTDIKTADTAAGKIYVDGKGMSLYTFKKDTAGVSNCYDDCAANWPPVIASNGAESNGALSLIKRKDGSMQWAFNQMPLYTFANDKAAGDINGQGVFEVWYLAKP
jgi:predicted lipoprotein with Yx(FWY)xxD motif